ncbi:hypothetical protein TWF696_004935 [Orbilia brochopaga]|uniref:Uncharacterized protein n=1 Tax=Orbilia brochopaga TaxID=3140254 RepID=A0AAV9V299_9PEZI
MQFKPATILAITNLLLTLSAAANPVAANDLATADLQKRDTHILQARVPRRRGGSSGDDDEEDEEDNMGNSTSTANTNSAPMSLGFNAALAAGAGVITVAALML